MVGTAGVIASPRARGRDPNWNYDALPVLIGIVLATRTRVRGRDPIGTASGLEALGIAIGGLAVEQQGQPFGVRASRLREPSRVRTPLSLVETAYALASRTAVGSPIRVTWSNGGRSRLLQSSAA